MRPLEALLFAADALALLTLVVPLPASMLWMRNTAYAASLAAAVQVLAEGPRWQAAGAYILPVFLIAARLLQAASPESFRVHPAAYAAAAGSGAVVLAVSAALAVLLPVFRIPPPTGPFAVGTRVYHWMDGERGEIFTDDPSDRREIVVQLWYPAAPGASGRRARYAENTDMFAPLARLLRLPPFLFSHVKYVETNAVEKAPVAGGGARFPVLVFSHGRGGYRRHNTRTVEELASHGYAVAAIDHTYASSGVVFPDGKLVPLDGRMTERDFADGTIPYLARDASFTLDRLEDLNRSDPDGLLEGRLDLGRAGIFGLSLGGEIAAEACLADPRFKACLVMDVWMTANVLREGLRVPAMFLTRDAETMRLEGWSEADIDETLSTMRRVYDGLPGDGYFVKIPGMFHQDFSDAPLFTPLASLLGLSGPIDRNRARDVVDSCVKAFFDRHLNGGPVAPSAGDAAPRGDDRLSEPAVRFPEILFESKRP